jgi:hypothetical protein
VTESISATYKSRSSFAKASIAVPVLTSLSGAQSMAIMAPLPEYSYEAKRRDVTGSGVCVIAVDTGSVKVTDAIMERSTGNRVLDKVTVEIQNVAVQTGSSIPGPITHQLRMIIIGKG